MCRNPSLGLATNTRGCYKVAGQVGDLRVTHMLLGVQRVWGNQPSHSQVNSHGGNWTPKWTPKTSKSNFRGQNSMACGIIYIIGYILECRCLKWARIAHSNIWNTSYGQKKGRESNCQFDSWPQKVGNRPDSLVFRGRATYHWNALDMCYNLALDYILIRGLITKLWGSKATGSLNLGDFRTPKWESWDKKPFGYGLRGQSQSIL
jgi:hypothetical protein